MNRSLRNVAETTRKSDPLFMPHIGNLMVSTPSAEPWKLQRAEHP